MNQRHKLEQLCRYITRPAIANERLKLNAYMDNGMDPLHFLTGLIWAKMEVHINHLEAEWINYEDYNDWP
jgi:hypothetical protein